MAYESSNSGLINYTIWLHNKWSWYTCNYLTMQWRRAVYIRYISRCTTRYIEVNIFMISSTCGPSLKTSNLWLTGLPAKSWCTLTTNCHKWINLDIGQISKSVARSFVRVRYGYSLHVDMLCSMLPKTYKRAYSTPGSRICVPYHWPYPRARRTFWDFDDARA